MFILTYIKAWGILMTPILSIWVIAWSLIKVYFSEWNTALGDYVLPEKNYNIIMPIYGILTALLIIGVLIWCWYIAGDVLNFFSGLKGE